MLVLSLNMFGADACREARVATAAGGGARLFHLLLVGGESFLVPLISECIFILFVFPLFTIVSRNNSPVSSLVGFGQFP